MRAFEFRFYDPISYIFIYSDWYEKMSEFFQAYEKTDWGRNEQFPLQQYTGLQDAKGNKIFEGDLVTDSQDQIMVTEFYNGAFCAKSKSGSMWPFSDYLLPYVNIVGNIYENKELFDEQK